MWSAIKNVREENIIKFSVIFSVVFFSTLQDFQAEASVFCYKKEKKKFERREDDENAEGMGREIREITN